MIGQWDEGAMLKRIVNSRSYTNDEIVDKLQSVMIRHSKSQVQPATESGNRTRVTFLARRPFARRPFARHAPSFISTMRSLIRLY